VNYIAEMDIEAIEIHKNLISVNSGDVVSLLGSSGEELDQYTLDLVTTYISECKEVSSPQGAYARINACETDSNEEIEIEGIRFKTGKIVNKMLRKSEAYAFFVCTAGPGPERLARTLFEEGQYLDGYIVDIIGSGIVESVANQVQEQIRIEAASQGLQITNRYSPGYCSWNVNEQQKLFRLIPERCCGITLSDSSLMSPIKSVSGIVGMGTSVEFRDYTCEPCPMRNCLFRKAGDYKKLSFL
jgi:hypothetical protein